MEKIFWGVEQLFLEHWTIFSAVSKDFYEVWKNFPGEHKIIWVAEEFESSKIFAVGQADFWGAGGVLAAEKFIGHFRIFL